MQATRICRRLRRHRDRGHALRRGERAHHRRRRGRRRDVERAGRIGLSTFRERRAQREHIGLLLEGTIHGNESVVHRAAHEIPRGSRGPCDRARHRGRESLDRLERSIEPVEDAIERHAHLVGERVAGVVVWALRRPTRIREIIRMILRLEHVEYVRTERLVALHHVRSGGILLAGHAERSRRSIHDDTHVQQRIHELRRRREVRLVARQDVAAGIAQLRRMQHLRVILDVRAAPELEDGITHWCAGSWRRRAGGCCARPHRHAGIRAAPTTTSGSYATARGRISLDLFLHRIDAARARRPRVSVAAIDGILPHAPEVEQQVLPLA